MPLRFSMLAVFSQTQGSGYRGELPTDRVNATRRLRWVSMRKLVVSCRDGSCDSVTMPSMNPRGAMGAIPKTLSTMGVSR